MNQDNGKITTKDRQDRAPGMTGDDRGAATAQGSGLATRDKDGKGELVTSAGRTSIADAVVAKVAGMAAREIGGVHAMGASMGRRIGSVKEHIPGIGKSIAQGVSVEVGERQAAVDIDLVVEYGLSIPDLAGAVRDNVIKSVEYMCGLEVVEVNVTVDDIHLPDEDGDQDEGNRSSEPREPREPRVQ